MASVRKRRWRTMRGVDRTAWTVDFKDAAGNRDRRQFGTKREAEAFRIELEGQLRAATFRPDAARVSVAEACEAFVAHCRSRMERGERMTRHNLKVYEGHVRNHILHPELGIGQIKLAQLSARSISDFRDRLREGGTSVPTTRKVLSTLHGVLAFAISRDVIAANPARGIRVIGRRDEAARRIVPPSKELVAALLEAAEPDLQVVLLVAIATGVRAGELHALRWRHLNLDRGEAKIETRVDAYGAEDTTKTAAGVRTIPLGRPVVNALKAWRLRSRFARPDDLVFPNSCGSYVSHDNLVKRRYKPLLARVVDGAAGCPGSGLGSSQLTWHALRHFAISSWIEAGLSPKTVQVFAGHSSLQVTMDRYGHLFPSDEHQFAMDQIAAALVRQG